jgi:hypothetical protein
MPQSSTFAALRRHGLEWVKGASAGRWDFTDAKPSFKLQQYSKSAKSVALVASDAVGGLFAWQNPFANSIFVTRVILHVTTEASGSCTADVGRTSAAAATNNALIDGANVGAAAIDTDNVAETGDSIGIALDAKGGTNDYITGSKASGASAGIVGYAIIEYVHLVED